MTFPEVGSGAEQVNVGDRLFLWGHVAGIYNDSYCKNQLPSKIEPVDAAEKMELRNMYFIRYDNKPRLPFTDYYTPFKKLDQVLWSLTGANGVTSQEEREAAFALAAANRNVVGFIMDDFFQSDPTSAGNWLAKAKPNFPVVVTLTPPEPTVATKLTLAQSIWSSGNYRSKDIVIEISYDGKEWQQIEQLTLPNQPGAKAEVKLPAKAFSGLRAKFLNTYDSARIASCGLSLLELSNESKQLDCSSWKIAASSSNADFPADVLIKPDVPFPASLTVEQLRDIRKRLVIDDRRLRLSVSFYLHQFCPRAKLHLEHVDEILFLTWKPEDLVHLEENLTKLERLVPGKSIVLGCYMFNFDRMVPISVDQMKYQIELGHRWLQQGRINSMIFLASPLYDLDLEAVDFTKKWIAEVKDQPLKNK